MLSEEFLFLFLKPLFEFIFYFLFLVLELLLEVKEPFVDVFHLLEF